MEVWQNESTKVGNPVQELLVEAIISLLLLHILLCIFNKKLNMQMHDKSGKEEVYLRSSRPDLTRKIEIPNH